MYIHTRYICILRTITNIQRRNGNAGLYKKNVHMGVSIIEKQKEKIQEKQQRKNNTVASVALLSRTCFLANKIAHKFSVRGDVCKE